MLELFTALRRFCGENAALFGTTAAASDGCGYLEAHWTCFLARSRKTEKKSNGASFRLARSFLVFKPGLVESGILRSQTSVPVPRQGLGALDVRTQHSANTVHRPMTRHASVDNFGLMPEFSPELSFDSPSKVWESTFRHKEIHCSILEHAKDSLLKTTTCKTLTRQCLSYEQSYPVFVGRNRRPVDVLRTTCVCATPDATGASNAGP